MLLFNKIFSGIFQFTSKWRRVWHIICPQISCQVNDLIENFCNLIPSRIPDRYKQRPEDFSRKRNLPIDKLIALILSLATSGSNQGVDAKIGSFFKNARRSNLWPDASAVHRSSVTKARAKLDWRIFNEIFSDAVCLAYRLWPKQNRYLWHGMSVFAIDGSKFDLPATEQIRAGFDPKSGLQHQGKGHYPQCLVSTVYDVLRRLPIARSVVSCHGSEREQMIKLAPCLPDHSLCLFDQGYQSFETINYLTDHFNGYFVFRCPSKGSFAPVEQFAKSAHTQDIVWIEPSHEFKRKAQAKLAKQPKPLKLRLIRLLSPDGTVSVLLTNLFDTNNYPAKQIIDLYFRRWQIESYYRDEKLAFELERFHSKTVNGILQEIYAAAVMSVICRTLMALSSQCFYSGKKQLQFKNAMVSLASEVAFLTAKNPEHAVLVFKDLLTQMARVRYYQPQNSRPPQPRINKKPLNKWSQSKLKQLLAMA